MSQEVWPPRIPPPWQVSPTVWRRVQGFTRLETQNIDQSIGTDAAEASLKDFYRHSDMKRGYFHLGLDGVLRCIDGEDHRTVINAIAVEVGISSVA